MSDAGTYAIKTSGIENGIRFFFISKGRQDIIKVVQYQFVQEFLGYSLFNLGFGDYDVTSDEILDDANSNNGDAYTVFHTVLKTVPVFFSNFPNAMLVVQGSDSGADFLAACRTTCIRNCLERCRKFNRRITIYRQYVNMNFSLLSKDYNFFGAFGESKQRLFESFLPNKAYDAVFLQKRELNLMYESRK